MQDQTRKMKGGAQMSEWRFCCNPWERQHQISTLDPGGARTIIDGYSMEWLNVS